MFFDRPRPAVGVAIPGEPESPDPRGFTGIDSRKRLIAGGIDDFLVNCLVEVEVGHKLSGFPGRDHPVVQFLQLGKIGIGGVPRRALCRDAFKPDQDLDRSLDILRRQDCDRGPGVGANRDQAFSFQNLEGLAQGGA